MIEFIYYVGVICVEYIQGLYAGSDDILSWLNNLADPHYAYSFIFPFVAVFDSAFASQHLLVAAAGEWLNVILKWILSEHRPYWWVQETDYYTHGPRPVLRQTLQTCETGPGCPSGHLMSVSSHLVLLCMWASHVAADCKSSIPNWLCWIAGPILILLATHVGVARMYVATHFPHQVLLGAFCGLIFTPILTIFVSDPFIWGRIANIRRRQMWHVAAAAACAALGAALYWTMKAMGVDPQWSVKLAFKWCEDPHSIHVSTTPMFSLVESCAALMSFALFTTRSVARYRYNSKNRSLLIAVTCGVCAHYLSSLWQARIPTDNVLHFYVHQVVYYLAQGCLYLRVIPFLATLPYRISDRKTK